MDKISVDSCSFGDEMDHLTKMALSFSFSRTVRPMTMEIKDMIDKDLKARAGREWTHFLVTKTRQIYFKYINQKTPRPWLQNSDSTRKVINLITNKYDYSLQYIFCERNN